MTDQEINKAIAEALGWTNIRGAGFDNEIIGNPPANATHPCGTLVRGGWILPDFVNDLNEMHQAEKQLSCRAEQIRFIHHLPILEWDAIHATARQRAEAFLRTMGKWREK